MSSGQWSVVAGQGSVSRGGTVGFVKLGEALGRSPKVLMRMFSAKGNPQAKNLFEIVAYLQKAEGTVLEVVERAA